MKVAVIAGTPVDTQMGIDFLRRKDPSLEMIFCPLANNPRECHLFQISDDSKKTEQISNIYRRALDDGAECFFIYCNSLSSSVDFLSISEHFNTVTVTPMNAYEVIAENYDTIGVLAANNQSTKGIEDRFNAANPQGFVIGVGDLKLTEAVEHSMPPSQIAEKYHLEDICRFFEAGECEAIVLGCTHFPWFKNEISALTDLPVIDPADIMYDQMMNSV